jgi:hypothetical protein
MAKQEDGHVRLTTQEARQGRTPGIVRYVLGTSLALAVIAGIIVYANFSTH